MYHNLFNEAQKAIVMVLNPLDSLGDNQVAEKEMVNITAINLTKMALNMETAQDIIDGKYSFIYLSPEVLLNNPIFHHIFFSEEFQARLSLIVVDEAHMVYMWGLVESGESKQLNSHGKHQDITAFRPCYGQLAEQFMATFRVPILLQSATCRPIAVKAILRSLKLKEDEVTFVRGELSRKEITILRVTMEQSMASPLTMQVFTFARRYHLCTGDKAKEELVNHFVNGAFPVISSTMALGLGQNWQRVARVVHVGRGDPATLFQMIGQCGRGGNPGLAILFVEQTRKNGKNDLSDFENPEFQNDDDRMDALAITPVCFRIVFAVDNMVGYIPLSKDNPNVVRKAERQASEEFPPCACSNCKPVWATAWKQMIHVHTDNFSRFILDPEGIPKIPNNDTFVRPKGSTSFKPGRSTDEPLDSIREEWANHLCEDFEQHYTGRFNKSTLELSAKFLFPLSRARAFVLGLEEQDSLIAKHRSACMKQLSAVLRKQMTRITKSETAQKKMEAAQKKREADKKKKI
ncbi:hypothetical protein PTTG_00926, partial [Puccinia triticina 1-1 BBBD Race 1]